MTLAECLALTLLAICCVAVLIPLYLILHHQSLAAKAPPAVQHSSALRGFIMNISPEVQAELDRFDAAIEGIDAFVESKVKAAVDAVTADFNTAIADLKASRDAEVAALKAKNDQLVAKLAPPLSPPAEPVQTEQSLAAAQAAQPAPAAQQASV